MSKAHSEPNTQLYLVLPENLPQDIEQTFASMLASGTIVSVMMDVKTAQNDADLAQTLIQLAQNAEVAFLLGVHHDSFEQGLSHLKQWSCDGLHLYDPDMNVKAVRQRLGSDYILGSFCGLSRHDAMQHGENGADYIAVGADDRDRVDLADISFVPLGEENQDLLNHGDGQEIDQILAFMDWYMDVFELPLVAWDPASIEVAQKYSRQGAEFIALKDMIWNENQDISDIMKQLEAILIS